MRSTFKVLFYTKKQSVKNGKAPIMGRITINGTQAGFSCKKEVSLTLWDVKANRAKGKSEEALSIRNLIISRPKLPSTISIFATMTVLSRLRRSITVTSVLVRTITRLWHFLKSNLNRIRKR